MQALCYASPATWPAQALQLSRNRNVVLCGLSHLPRAATMDSSYVSALHPLKWQHKGSIALTHYLQLPQAPGPHRVHDQKAANYTSATKVDKRANQLNCLGCCLHWFLESPVILHLSAISITLAFDPYQQQWRESTEEEKKRRIQMRNISCRFLMAVNCLLFL